MAAWYRNTREGFLSDALDIIVSRLHENAAAQGWNVEEVQDEEWRASIQDLRRALGTLPFVQGVLAEYDFLRRGLRIDFVLVGRGAIYVLEFKRGQLQAADRDQVMNYAINLVEFHELTQTARPKVFPILVSRMTRVRGDSSDLGWQQDWSQIPDAVICTDPEGLASTLAQLSDRVPPDGEAMSVVAWDESPFHPSSTIVDATLSLYGQHTVSAIKEHAVPQAEIAACVESVKQEIRSATQAGRHELILVSGAPGAGKTLVGLAIAFSPEFRSEALFVTGNTPLVDVLNGSLRRSYLSLSGSHRFRPLAGYTTRGVAFVARNSDFKIAKAHAFLKSARARDVQPSMDGRVLIFDEAQRTYEEGTQVNRQKLVKDEALLILDEMEKAQRGISVIVLLVGHNQDINVSELGAIAWIKAARAKGWRFAASEETLLLSEFASAPGGASLPGDPLRIRIEKTHLGHSMRDLTRNGKLEQWADFVMTNQPRKAANVAASLPEKEKIRVTRSLHEGMEEIRRRLAGELRGGIIASGQGRRLRAEGIFVEERPDIVEWMLEPGDDIRSSNLLERTQNQYQIQGLEIDFALVCWDADLRRGEGGWQAHNITGKRWTRRKGEDKARANSYRVLLTRSRRGMVIFVPRGDLHPKFPDTTRSPQVYDAIAQYLMEAGAVGLGGERT